ncbi:MULTISPECIES: hypothetical protein [unclassified Bacillus (in: firmicutes)]|uniref:hypothetical protein n=1 Tax=unclassified Bacillus (in: firmicutes) TaxID=185979 RepID=UPI001BE8D6C7|nr:MULTISPECIES: hypothetical protein [unclassified Bacillus (in: firmicutes)]MBT2618866.1 hypothetical protein [Bacillus sp. ISL-78]MBT2627843.1 hypothetical protein [Bacillus sp. ISL-101]
MNQYLIGIHKGELSNPQLNELMEYTSKISKNSITTISISSPENLTLLVGEEESQLSTGLTDQYYLLTNELQKLNQYQDKFYFVYDYRNRKIVKNPTVRCFPLIKITISGTKLQNLIQTVKGIKQDVFAGFKINLEESDLLIVEVLLSSPMLEMINKGERIPESLQCDKHYLYLSELTELLSDPRLCNSVQTKAITD